MNSFEIICMSGILYWFLWLYFLSVVDYDGTNFCFHQSMETETNFGLFQSQLMVHFLIIFSTLRPFTFHSVFSYHFLFLNAGYFETRIFISSLKCSDMNDKDSSIC